MGKDFDDLAAIKERKGTAHSDEDIVIKSSRAGQEGYIKPFDLVIHKGGGNRFYRASGFRKIGIGRVLYGAERSDEKQSVHQGKER